MNDEQNKEALVEDTKNITSYAMKVLESNPEALEKAIKERGVELAVPSFIASLIKKVYEDRPETPPEALFSAVVTIFGAIDRMLTEGGIGVSKEQKMLLIQKSVELILQTIPELGKQVSQEAGMAEQQPQPQGVL